MTVWPDGSSSITPPRVSSVFGPRAGGAFGFHYGVDLVGFHGIKAVSPGLVTFAGWLNDNAGNTIVIDLGGGTSHLYMHNEVHHVARGMRVAEGAALALMGDTGNATGRCLHFEVREHGTSVDPIPWVQSRLQAPAPAGKPTREKKPMIINIQGRSGVRRGGAYYIADGRATFLGEPIKGVPQLDYDQGTALAQRVAGIG